MGTDGISGMGAVLVFNGETINEVESLDGGEITIEFEDILTMDSISMYADTILTALNSGQMTITCIFQPTVTTGNYTLLKDLAEVRQMGTLLLTYDDGSRFTGSAGIINVGFPSAPDAKGVQRFSCTFKRDGKFTFVGS